jgi:hypothetical protein
MWGEAHINESKNLWSPLYRKSDLCIPRNETARPRSQYRNQTFISDSHRPLHLQCDSNNQREWIIYRGPGFLAVVWVGSSPPSFSHQQVLSFLYLTVCRRSSYRRAGVGRGFRGTTSYDSEKPWSSINHSILSGTTRFIRLKISTVLMHWIILEDQCAMVHPRYFYE